MSSLSSLFLALSLVTSRCVVVRDESPANSNNSTAGFNVTIHNGSVAETGGSSKTGSWVDLQTAESSTTTTIAMFAGLLFPVGMLVFVILCCMDESPLAQDGRSQHRGGHGPKGLRPPQQEPLRRSYTRETPQSRMSPMQSSSSNLHPQALSAMSASPPQSAAAISGLEVRTLCPEFVVKEPIGVVYAIPDMLLPEPQNVTLDIRDGGGSGRVVAQAVASESTDHLIRIETSYPGPAILAVLDTTFALQNAAATGARYAILRRTKPDGRMDEMSTPFAVFFLNRAVNGATLVARSGDSPGRSRPLITALLDNNLRVKAVFDADQRPLAAMEDASGTWNGTAIRVNHGADALLVLCAVIATQKLR